MDRILAALSDSTRRNIVRRLAEIDLTVSEIAAPYDMTLAAVSKHVHVLERAGLLRQARKGRSRVCTLAPEALHEAASLLVRLEGCWRERCESESRFRI